MSQIKKLIFQRTLAAPATFGRSPEPRPNGVLRQDLEDSGKLSGHRHPRKSSGNSTYTRGEKLFYSVCPVSTVCSI
jgi:hypothetical protein